MSGPVVLLAAAVFAPLVAGLVGMAVAALLPRVTLARVLISAAGPLTSLVLIGIFLGQHGLEAGRVSAAWMPALELNLAFRADALGVFFSLVVAGIGVLITIYARAYLGDDAASMARLYPLLLAFMTAMLGLVLADDLMLMLLFWEMTSVTSFLLIGWDYTNKEGVKKAMQAFVTTGFGGLTLFGGLVLLGSATGAWSFTALEAMGSMGPTTAGVVVAAVVLIYLGAAAKSAQWPVHYWLPGAMLAPTPISAYLHSAAMVKAGIYLLSRLFPQVSGLEMWPVLVAGIGGVTMLLGAFIALQRDVLKQILAYTTISQLGLLACALGLGHWVYQGQPNLVWHNAQVLNHALYKAALFILAGAVTHELGTKCLHQMHGILKEGGRKKMYGWLFVLAGAGLAALPGTFSFFAKEAFLYQIWNAWKASGSWLILVLMLAAVLTSVFNVAILVRFVQTFLTPPPVPESAKVGLEATDTVPPDGHGVREADAQYYTEDTPKVDAHGHVDDEHPHDTWAWRQLIWLPAGLLIGLQILGGIFGPWFTQLVGLVEASPFYLEPRQWSLWYVLLNPSVPLGLSVLGVAAGVGLGVSPLLRGIRGDVHDRLFPAFYAGVLRTGGLVFGSLQTGRMRWYMWATLVAMGGAMAWVVYADWGTGEFTWPRDQRLPSPITDPGPWLLMGLLCGTAIVMTIYRKRASRVLLLGTIGFAMTGVFYLYVAPDLALTQLSIEIVSIVLFLLVLNLLPDEEPRDRTLVPVRLAAAVFVGLSAGAVTLWSATAERPDRPYLASAGEPPANLGDWFLRNSYDGLDTAAVDRRAVGSGVVDRGEAHLRTYGTKVVASGVAGRPGTPVSADAPGDSSGGDDVLTVHKGGGGANVVNVILVDFRSFDTLGEVAVLGLAALGVWTLLRKPPTERALAAADAPGRGVDPPGPSRAGDEAFIDPYARPEAVLFNPLPRGVYKSRAERIASPVLKSAAMLLVPLAMVFSAYLFFRGHQSPGGGFVGGLASAVALVVYRMCFGSEALYKVLPVPERVLIGVGLLVATGTAVAPLLWGLPLLTSTHGYLPLGGDMYYHWSTVLAFDVGVYLIVVGSVVGMIDALAREVES